jgi:hypothetical protein
VAFGAGRAAAADLPAPKAAPRNPWRVALALFCKVDAATLAETEKPEFSLEHARRIAASALYGSLSGTFPSLVQSALTPLPDRRTAQDTAAPTAFTDLSATGAKGNSDSAPFVDLSAVEFPMASEASATGQIGAYAEKISWDGLVCGFFTLEGETIDCRVLLIDAGSATASRTLAWKGGIGNLDQFTAALLPAMASWVAGRDLGVIDIAAQPEKGPPLSLALEPETDRAALKGSRLFVEAAGDYLLRLERAGFEPRTLKISGVSPGIYRKEIVPFTPAAIHASVVPLANAGSILTWTESDRFHRAEKRFRSSLGRFVASVPLTAIAFGVFFSYSEAYARGAASDSTYYASGAGAVAAAGLSVGFLIDCAFSLVNVINASK